MRNPIAIFNDLREMYLRYLDSPYDLRYPDLVRERRSLIDRNGRIYRDPLIEAVQVYEKCPDGFAQVAQELLAAELGNQELIDDLATFTGMGLFPRHGSPTNISEDAFAASTVDHRDVIITTGQVPAKLSALFLPVACLPPSRNLSAGLHRTLPDPRRAWWRHYTMQGQRPAMGAPYQPASPWSHERRPSEHNSHPLNALVEDQLARLRDGFDSGTARDWLDQNRLRNRILFR